MDKGAVAADVLREVVEVERVIPHLNDALSFLWHRQSPRLDICDTAHTSRGAPTPCHRTSGVGLALVAGSSLFPAASGDRFSRAASSKPTTPGSLTQSRYTVFSRMTVSAC